MSMNLHLKAGGKECDLIQTPTDITYAIMLMDSHGNTLKRPSWREVYYRYRVWVMATQPDPEIHIEGVRAFIAEALANKKRPQFYIM
jgi:hypothetical protein